MAQQRLQRVASLVQQEISLLLKSGQLKDPRIDPLVSVTDVTVSSDIKYAKVYISHYDGAAHSTEAVSALNHAAGHIQRIVGKALQARETPRLTFIQDSSLDRGFRITKALDQLNLDPADD